MLGQLQQVKAIYPVDVRPASANENTAKIPSASEDTASAADTPENHKEKHRPLDTCKHDSQDPPVSDAHLTPDQQEKVRQMLRVCCIFKRRERCGMHSILAVKNQAE